MVKVTGGHLGIHEFKFSTLLEVLTDLVLFLGDVDDPIGLVLCQEYFH